MYIITLFFNPSLCSSRFTSVFLNNQSIIYITRFRFTYFDFLFAQQTSFSFHCSATNTPCLRLIDPSIAHQSSSTITPEYKLFFLLYYFLLTIMLNQRALAISTTPFIDRSQCRSTPRALTAKPPPVSRTRFFRNQTEDDISVQSLSQTGDQSIDTTDDPVLIPASKPRQDSEPPKSHVQDLPPEILEAIVGHVVGHLCSTIANPSGLQHNVRNWNAIMRHPRRKNVADLALVSDTWRRLIQERVYRHSEAAPSFLYV